MALLYPVPRPPAHPTPRPSRMIGLVASVSAPPAAPTPGNFPMRYRPVVMRER